MNPLNKAPLHPPLKGEGVRADIYECQMSNVKFLNS